MTGVPFAHLLLTSALTVAGVAASLASAVLPWLAGQALLAVALTQWFAILHECGHGTFSGNRRLDTALGHLAGFFCAMPFSSWRLVHHGHHLWTGWRDRDPTTRGIVPRPIGRGERLFFNACWQLWVPIFSLAYRATIFWHLPKLTRWYRKQRRALTRNVALLLIAYAVCAPWLVPVGGLALLLHFWIMDPILLSQHSHIPQRLAGDATVRPVPKDEQHAYTRSVLLPRWISTWVFLGFDLHGLHHVHPRVAGYRLHRFTEPASSTMSWWRWVKDAKRIPAHVLIFQNRDQSGIHI